MRKQFPHLLLILTLFPLGISGQINISGDITPSGLLRLSNGSLINLPFRLGNISVDYANGDFELKTVTAIETRWENAEFDSDMIQVREAYLTWYPAMGEVRLGKMIHAWGAADANNPTDNLSPYDYYYMFLAGTDRKIGTLSAAAKVYYNDFQIELIGIPEFEANRLPLNEPDFPIQIPIPSSAEYFMPEDGLEIGGRIQYALGLGDISVSYFNGYDRSSSPAGVQIDTMSTPFGPSPAGDDAITQHLTYRTTDAFGLDAVLFPGDWTLRGELAYFRTKTPDIEYAMSKFTYDAEYIQSVMQVEYAFANGIQLMGQYINTHHLSTDSEFVPDDVFSKVSMTLENPHPLLDPLRDQFSQFGTPEFSAGMGTPFALISDQVIMFSTMSTFLDNALELSGMFMINLEETGYMTNLSSQYSIMEGLNLETSIGYFIGGDEEGNKFKELEDFSNLNLGLTYSF